MAALVPGEHLLVLEGKDAVGEQLLPTLEALQRDSIRAARITALVQALVLAPALALALAPALALALPLAQDSPCPYLLAPALSLTYTRRASQPPASALQMSISHSNRSASRARSYSTVAWYRLCHSSLPALLPWG